MKIISILMNTYGVVEAGLFNTKEELEKYTKDVEEWSNSEGDKDLYSFIKDKYGDIIYDVDNSVEDLINVNDLFGQPITFEKIEIM